MKNIRDQNKEEIRQNEGEDLSVLQIFFTLLIIGITYVILIISLKGIYLLALITLIGCSLIFQYFDSDFKNIDLYKKITYRIIYMTKKLIKNLFSSKNEIIIIIKFLKKFLNQDFIVDLISIIFQPTTLLNKIEKTKT